MVSKKTGLAGSPLARSASRTRSVVSVLQEGSGGEGLLHLRVDELIANPANPSRRSEDSEATQQLARSMEQVGVIQPLSVVAATDFAGEFPQHAEAVGSTGWVVLAGHRRRVAAQIAGLEVVPAVVRAAARAGEVMLHENLHRDELTPIEEAQAFAREMKQQGLTQRTLAEHAGVSQGHVNKRLQLLKLPNGLQARVASGEIAAARAVDLVKECDKDVLVHLADTFDANPWHLDSKVHDSRRAVLNGKLLAAAKERAEREGVELLEDPDTTFHYNGWDHVLRTSKDIEAARKRDDLAFGPARRLEDEPIAYRVSAKQAKNQGTSAREAQEKQQEKDRRAAMKTRRAFLGELARKKPSKADQLSVAVATTLAGMSLGGQVTHVARLIAQEAGVGPADETDDWAWRVAVGTVEAAATREHLAWVINLAALEDGACWTHTSGWNRASVDYLQYLIGYGYSPTPWEQDRLTAAEPTGTVDDSTGITTDENAQEGQS